MSVYTVQIMALIRIDPDSPLPVIRQIVDALRVELVERHLSPGDQLPSVRRAALDLGVHFNTVAEAYRQLAEEGWLELKHGRGARVADRRLPRATRRTVKGYRQRLRELVSQMRAAGMGEDAISDELLHVMKGSKP